MLASYLPTDSDELAQFTVILSFAYTSVAYAFWGIRCAVRGAYSHIDYVAKVFGAVTFTSSTLVIASVFEKSIIPLLGDLRMFMIIAGMCGGIYSIHALFKG